MTGPVPGGESGEQYIKNPRLRLAAQNAKGVNMSKEAIKHAVSKGGKGRATVAEHAKACHATPEI